MFLQRYFFLTHPLWKHMKEKLEGHPYPLHSPGLPCWVSHLVFSALILFYYMRLFWLIAVLLLYVLLLFGDCQKIPGKILFAFCLLLMFGVCARMGRRVILPAPFCFCLLLPTLSLTPELQAGADQWSVPSPPPIPLMALYLCCPQLTCSFHRKAHSLSSLLWQHLLGLLPALLLHE